MGLIEALHILDEHNKPILEHIYTGRPPPSSTLIRAYLSKPPPRPSLIHLPSANPPSLLFSLTQDRLIFLAITSTDTDPLLVLEFLHRTADALTGFLGQPLHASKFESSQAIVAQILGEICDAGAICNTEPNALHEAVETDSWMGNILGGLGLPPSAPSASVIQRPISPLNAHAQSSSGFSQSVSAIPWRRANVRHTSNELYVDIVETLSILLAPSGRPISANVNGTIVFTSKISGVPDLLLSLTAPGGKTGIQHAMELPCFHPCVRLAKWKERPGEISFVPPDGQFVLVGYECDLLPDVFSGDVIDAKVSTAKLNIPATVEVKSSLGAYADEFEVRLVINTSVGAKSDVSSQGHSTFSRTFPQNSTATQSTSPTLQDVIVMVPLSSSVRTLNDLKTSRGEASFLAREGVLEWRIPNKEVASIPRSGATLRCSIVGPIEEDMKAEAPINGAMRVDTFDYDDGYRDESDKTTSTTNKGKLQSLASDQIAALMPRGANISFSIRGWLASGLKVESLNVNAKASSGIGAGMTPYKGVKYHTFSRKGVEVRC